MSKTHVVPRRPTRLPVVVQPIVIGCYTLTATGLIVEGRPSFGEHQGVGDFINRAHRASGFWLGDWLRYGETRSDWQERLSQAVEFTGYALKTLTNMRAIAVSVAPAQRRADVEYCLHEVVQGMTPSEQDTWLERAATEGWDMRELRDAVKASKRAVVVKGRALTMHTIELTVQMDVEAGSASMAEGIAWDELKHLLATQSRPAKVIASHARPR